MELQTAKKNVKQLKYNEEYIQQQKKEIFSQLENKKVENVNIACSDEEGELKKKVKNSLRAPVFNSRNLYQTKHTRSHDELVII